jgi:hypothetical protein
MKSWYSKLLAILRRKCNVKLTPELCSDFKGVYRTSQAKAVTFRRKLNFGVIHLTVESNHYMIRIRVVLGNGHFLPSGFYYF